MNRFAERRRHHREDVKLPATLVADAGLSRTQTVIINVSDLGAAINAGDAADVPNDFYMLVPDHRLQPCRVVWRDGQVIGVEFEV